VALALVGDHGPALMQDRGGRTFWKLVGSGNDFVFLDARASGDARDPLEAVDAIRALCAAHLGIGADGVVFLTGPGDGHDAAIRYYNSDGSRARLCGNASLCATQLTVRLGLASPDLPFRLRTDAGVLVACVTPGALDAGWVGLAPASDVHADTGDVALAGEARIGFAIAGVPHVVVLVADPEAVGVAARGAFLRAPTAARPAGANVNFVGRQADGTWAIRTFERGVEAETLACGTGAVASAAVLAIWGLAGANVALRTASGATLRVVSADGVARLCGEGRVAFEGTLGTL
jgi:diaminopimelate epimerase